jgi:hypothetical protein
MVGTYKYFCKDVVPVYEYTIKLMVDLRKIKFKQLTLSPWKN